MRNTAILLKVSNPTNLKAGLPCRRCSGVPQHHQLTVSESRPNQECQTTKYPPAWLLLHAHSYHLLVEDSSGYTCLLLLNLRYCARIFHCCQSRAPIALISRTESIRRIIRIFTDWLLGVVGKPPRTVSTIVRREQGRQTLIIIRLSQ